jgi:hypothetical protein
MTEPLRVVPNSPVPSCLDPVTPAQLNSVPAQAPLTEEQKQAAIREYIVAQIREKYMDLSKVIKQMNLPPHIEHSLFWDMDSWYGMAQQMSQLMRFAPEQQAPQPFVVPAPVKLKRKYTKAKAKGKNGKRKPA